MILIAEVEKSQSEFLDLIRAIVPFAKQAIMHFDWLLIRDTTESERRTRPISFCARVFGAETRRSFSKIDRPIITWNMINIDNSML